jgi:hypothetical protein
MEQNPKAWDINQMPWEVDIDLTPDFRWPYFSSLAANGLALATRMLQVEQDWYRFKLDEADLGDLKKAAAQALAAAQARVRDNLSADTIKQHGGGTKDERIEYVERIVGGAAEVQEQERAIFELDRRLADLDLAAEKAVKAWQRYDRTLRFFERLLGALSTFAPESAAGGDALTGRVPPWANGAGVIQDDGAGGESPHLPEGGRFVGGTAGEADVAAPDLSEEPPPGFYEETEIPF